MGGGFFADILQLRRDVGVGQTGFMPDLAVAFQHLEGYPAGQVAVCQENAFSDALFHIRNNGVKIAAVGKTQGLAFAFTGQGDGRLHGRLQSFAAAGYHGQHGNAQQLAQVLHINMDAGGTGLVHHVAAEHYGDAHFQHLNGEQQVAFQRRGVHHVDDGLHMPGAQLPSGHQFFL